jgi:pilus assembly protein Flp/PilA
MMPTVLSLFIRLKNRFLNEDGQDLVEYALVVAMLSFCAIAAERDVATSVAGAYIHLSTTFNGLM